MPENFNFLYSVVFTTTVFATFVSSIANILIAFFNIFHNKSIERRKRINEIDKYRYSYLYELLQHWEDYNIKLDDEDLENDTYGSLLCTIKSDSKRYNVAKPLLSACYVKHLEELVSKEEELYKEFAMCIIKKPSTEEFDALKDKHIDAGIAFSKALKSSIYKQLNDLMGE